MSALSSLPSVERLLQSSDASELVRKHGRPLTLDAIRLTLDQLRAEMKAAPETAAPPIDEILSRTELQISKWERSSLRAVINATGVILHTNLGRAPLSTAALHAMDMVSRGYSNLEFDLGSGKRGSRLAHADALLQKLLGVEAAIIVNNNASAVLLALSALAARKRAVIARSQLVEIGGGFRVPDVMKQSSVRLVEVGTTNKVRLSDYEAGMAEGQGLVMRVHRSNFRIVGFTEEPTLEEIVRAAHAAGRVLVDDLGSGTLIDTSKYGLAHEPMIQESVAAGADVICFSGDKLLGGPQAGIIVGRAELLQKIRRHPLARAVRADKTCLAAMAATLIHYLRDEAEREIPVWRMISMQPEALRRRAEAWAKATRQGEVIANESTVGGGSLPGEALATYVLAVDAKKPDHLLQRLREQDPPIVARAADQRVLLDPRTVAAEQDESLVAGLRRGLDSSS